MLASRAFGADFYTENNRRRKYARPSDDESNCLPGKTNAPSAKNHETASQSTRKDRSGVTSVSYLKHCNNNRIPENRLVRSLRGTDFRVRAKSVAPCDCIIGAMSTRTKLFLGVTVSL